VSERWKASFGQGHHSSSSDFLTLLWDWDLIPMSSSDEWVKTFLIKHSISQLRTMTPRSFLPQIVGVSDTPFIPKLMSSSSMRPSTLNSVPPSYTKSRRTSSLPSPSPRHPVPVPDPVTPPTLTARPTHCSTSPPYPNTSSPRRVSMGN